MGGFFGMASKKECLLEVFFGVDYHSHLGTKVAGLASYDDVAGLQRQIHSIDETPFRAKFMHTLTDMQGRSAIGCISDRDPQPLLIRSNLGTYAICVLGIINNEQELIEQYLSFSGGHFGAMGGGRINQTELAAALINQKNSFKEGIRFAAQAIKGTFSCLILKEDGKILAARDKMGRLPVLIGKNADGYCVSMESFAYRKLDCTDVHELGPGEIVEISADGIKTIAKPGKTKKICSFLWSYYGFPSATYEGVNVEIMRTKNGEIMARNEKEKEGLPDVDYVCGVPDSGTPHAIGYANESHIPFARPYVKYTPTWSRSFMPPNQVERDQIAKMKQAPVSQLIEGKKLLFVDDSIVRGTQLKETVDFLYQNGAKSVHMRSACPPIMYGCKYLNFSRATGDMDLLSRRIILELEGEEGFKHIDEYADSSTERGQKMRKRIAEKLGFDSLEFQTLDGVVEAIGLNPCELCTYCWNGKE